MADNSITENEIKIVTEILKKLEPGLLPFPIFLEIARLYVSCIVEVVPLYDNNGKIQVLLQEREMSDPVWGGKLHTPGTVLRANDKAESFESAFDRILNKELQGVSVVGQPVFVETIFHQVLRGRELALIFYVELESNDVSHLGKLYDVKKIPKEIVDTQIAFINDAVNKFVAKQ